MDELIKFLRARLDEDEAWAVACNRPYEYADEGSVAPSTGVHWQWVAGENWDPVKPDPAVMEFVEGPDREWVVNLATVEEWPKTYRYADGTIMDDRTMPRTYATEIVEMDPAAAGHIARHDPARVLADVAAKRAIIDDLTSYGEKRGDDEAAEWHREGHNYARFKVFRHLATAYADHPDFRAEWRLGAGTTPGE